MARCRVVGARRRTRVPGGSALGRPLRPGRPARKLDQPAQGAAPTLRPGTAASAHRGAPQHRRRGRHDQVAVVPSRRRHDRDGPDGLRRPGDGMRLQPGRLRHGLRLLRHRPGRLHPPPQRRRDRRAGDGGTPCVAPAALQRRLHGHGRAARQLRAHRGHPAAAARRRRAVGAPPHRVDGRHGARHQALGRRGAAGRPGDLGPRRHRCAARRAGADQPPPQPGLAGRCRHRLAPADRSSRELRMGADRRGERHARAAGCADRVGRPGASPRQLHPAQPHPGLAHQGNASFRGSLRSRAPGPGGHHRRVGRQARDR